MQMFYKSIQLILFILGSLLTVDCLVMFALLKFNFGTIVPFLIGLIFLVHAIYWQAISHIINNHKWLKRAWKIVWFLFITWLGSFLLFVFSLTKQINAQKNLGKVSAVIILGAGVNGDRPTPALASRLDKAAIIIKQQPTILPITTGGIGIGIGREYSEAYVMAKYLYDEHTIPMDTIEQEGESSSTEENLINSKHILKINNINPNQDSIAIVTNDFHTVRAKAIAHKQGYAHVTTVASTTPLSIRFNAWFREYFAFISGWMLGEY